MTTIGRNAPCPCGSGKKYKRCCLPVDQAAEVAARRSPEPPARRSPLDEDIPDFEALDRLSNRVPELISQGHIDEAEEVCRELLRRYPDEIDGVERLGHVHEARGELKTAAAHYRRAAAFFREGGDPEDEHATWLEALADRLDPP